MSYLGRYRQGEFVPLTCLCKTAAGLATVPDDAPFAKVFGPNGNVITSVQLPVLDRFVVNGLFQQPLRLGPSFATVGQYRAVYTYTLGGAARMDEDTFELVEGGSPDGAVISCFYYHKPFADFIVMELDSGRLVYGRNPKIS